MPHFHNSMVVVTKDELVPEFYTWDNLKANLARYADKSYGIKRVQKGGNGRPMLIDFDSLSREIQKALGDPRKCDHILERFYKEDGEAVTYFSSVFKFNDGTYLDMEYQERYIVNASVLKAVIRLREARIIERKSKGGSIVGIAGGLVDDAHSFQQTLRTKFKVEHTLPDNPRWFIKVLKDFEAEGYLSLVSGKHKSQNARKVTDETLALLNSLFAKDKTKPTATEVHRRYDAFVNGYIAVINNATGELYNPADFKKLSDATVKNYMAQWANKLATYAIRSGDRQKLMQQFKPHHSLDKPKFAGSIISIDDRQPPFKMQNGERIWFYNGIDLGSEAFVCAVYGDTKEGIIEEFYRQLLRNFHQWGLNLPAELECEMSLNSKFKDTFLREGAMFQHVRIEANNARGKRIERYFRTLRYEYEKEREGWLARPFAGSESNQAGSHDVPTLYYSDIVENGLSDIEKWNNQPHSVHTHMSRWQVFCEMQNPKLQPTNYIAVLPHIGRSTPTSCRVGRIRLQHKDYLLGCDGKIALGSKLIQLMKMVEGKDVTVYWLDDNDGVIFKALVFIDGLYICEAMPEPKYNRATIERGPEDELARNIMSAYVATIDGYARRSKNAIDDITLIDNRPGTPFSDFKMPGIRREVSDTPTGGIMPESEEYAYVPAATPQRRTLKDRF